MDADSRKVHSPASWLLFVLILLLGLFIRCHHLDYPFISAQDSGMFPSFARNLAELGPAKAGFLPVSSYFADGVFSNHIAHPPAAHLATAWLFQAFGTRESVYRLFNIVSGGLLAAVFLYLLLARRLNRRVALWALLFWAIIPSSAYFERMYTMNMQAQSLILAFLYFFWRYGEKADLRWGPPLALTCLLGGLTDWHFLFIFPPLFLLCMPRRRYRRLCFLCGLLTGGVILAYAVYAGLMKHDIKDFTWTAKGAGYWAGYAKNKLNPLEILNPVYLRRLAWLFTLHFTALGWLAPLGWLLALTRLRARGRRVFWYALTPLLLAGPAAIYFVLVPHNTYGHIWTLYWLMPPMAAAFGILMDYLCSRPLRAGSLPAQAAGLLLLASLAILAVPTLESLYRPGAYLTANTRSGQVMSRFADRRTYTLAENHDTLAYYAGQSVFDMPDPKFLMDTLDRETETGGKPPGVVCFNQAYRRMKPAGDLRALDAALAKRGYQPWLRQPTASWSRTDVSGLYLFMDQYQPPADAWNPGRRTVYFVDGSRLLRGFYQEVRAGRGRVVFPGVAVTGPRYFKASVFLGRLPRGDHKLTVDYKVEASSPEKTGVIASGRLGADNPQARVSVDLGPWAGRTVGFSFTWSASYMPSLKRPLMLFWAEPRLVAPGLAAQPSLWVKRGAPWFRESDLADGGKPVSLAQAAHFWASWLKKSL